MDSPVYAGSLDGSQLTVTNAGLTGPFSYLNGPLTVDDVDANAPRSTAISPHPLPRCRPGRRSLRC